VSFVVGVVSEGKWRCNPGTGGDPRDLKLGAASHWLLDKIPIGNRRGDPAVEFTRGKPCPYNALPNLIIKIHPNKTRADVIRELLEKNRQS
jgi:hypothetical protein